MTAMGPTAFALLVWGTAAAVLVVFAYVVAVLWRERRGTGRAR